jgi:hypothetical protein
MRFGDAEIGEQQGSGFGLHRAAAVGMQAARRDRGRVPRGRRLEGRRLRGRLGCSICGRFRRYRPRRFSESSAWRAIAMKIIGGRAGVFKEGFYAGTLSPQDQIVQLLPDIA